MTDGEFVDGDGGDRCRMSTQLPHKHQLIEIPDDARAITRPAHYDVVCGRGREASHGLGVAKQ